MRRIRWSILMLGVLATAAAAADDRARLQQERTEVERRYTAESAACSGRFATTSCLDEARLRRRDALVALQAREAALQQRERRESSERRAQERASRSVTASGPAAAPAPAPAASAARRAAASPPAPRQAEPAGSQASAAASRVRREQQARAAYERRQQRATEHRRQVQERAAAHESKAAPLPAGPASAASRPRR